jgi:prepilin-type N-terminal cleavage/methylation domain-containing protein
MRRSGSRIGALLPFGASSPSQSGVTMIELMVVVSITLMLGSIASAAYGRMISRAKRAEVFSILQAADEKYQNGDWRDAPAGSNVETADIIAPVPATMKHFEVRTGIYGTTANIRLVSRYELNGRHDEYVINAQSGLSLQCCSATGDELPVSAAWYPTHLPEITRLFTIRVFDATTVLMLNKCWRQASHVDPC